MFEYELAGTLSARSGFSAAILRHDLEDLLGQRPRSPPGGFAALAAAYEQSPQNGRKALAHPPFLMVGHILEHPAANVYIKRQGVPVGLCSTRAFQDLIPAASSGKAGRSLGFCSRAPSR